MFSNIHCLPGISTLRLLFLVSLVLPTTYSLKVAPGSRCTSLCTDGGASSSQTNVSMIVCRDSQYSSTSQGARFEDCINCELDSNHVDESTGESDLAWALYNLRYAFDSCVFGFPESATSSSNPCIVSCAFMQDQIQRGIKVPQPTEPFDYCQDGTFMDRVGQCTFCWSILDDQKFFASFLNVLQLGCEEQPEVEDGLANYPSPFNNNPAATSAGNVNIPTAGTSGTESTASASPSGESGGLSTGAKVGIGMGALIGFVIVVACLTVCITRRRKKMRGQHHHFPPWAGEQVPIPTPHSPAWPIYTNVQPYRDTSPIINKEESPITPLDRILYPKGSSVVRERETEMELIDQKRSPSQQQQQYIWPEQARKLKLQTEYMAHRNETTENSAYTSNPSADGKEVSPMSFA